MGTPEQNKVVYATFPIGYCIILHEDEEIPEGFLELNGQIVSKVDYPELFEVMKFIKYLFVDENTIKLDPQKFIEAYQKFGKDISKIKFAIKAKEI